MTKYTVRIKQWAGGQSSDDTRGPAGSAAYVRSLNFRSKPSVIQLQPQLNEDADGVITDLIMDIVQVPSGDIYAIGDTGNFYKRNASDGVWLLISDLGEASGGTLIYRSDMDAILIPLQTKVAQYSPIAGTPTATTLEVNKYIQSASTDVAATRSGGTSTYTPPTAITESATAKNSFQPDIEPLYSIKLKVITKGTGDWTVTLHDGANNVLYTNTITNANLVNNSLNEFVFSSPVRMLVKPNARTYHFHVTSTVADGTIVSSASNDLSTCDYQILASRLVTSRNALHPAIQFLQYTLYGNERYLATHEPLEDNATNDEFKRHRLTFPSGLEVCGLALYQSYVAIALERQNTNGALAFQDGLIALWNGVDTTYNQVIPILEGAPRSLFSYEGQLYWQADGSWYRLVGQQPERIRRFPNATEEFSGVYPRVGVNPNMMAIRKGVLLAAFPTETIDTATEYGVYSLGSLDNTYDRSFGLDCIISTGSRFYSASNNLQIGCIKNFGDELFVSWRDDSNAPINYGIDVIGPLAQAAGTGRYEALWFDGGEPERYQDNLRMKVVFNTLTSGQTVTPIWRTQRDGTWTNEDGSIAQGVSGDTSVVIPIEVRSTEVQVGFLLNGNGSNIQVRTVAIQIDNLKTSRHGYLEEEDLGVNS